MDELYESKWVNDMNVNGRMIIKWMNDLNQWTNDQKMDE